MNTASSGISKPLKLVGILLMALLLVWTGYSREKRLLLIEQGRPMLINRYPKPEVARFEKEQMKGNLGVKVPVKLQSSVLFSLLFMFLSAGLLYLYSGKPSVAKAVILLYTVYMISCFLLLKLGQMGVDYRLSTGLSHYLEDLFLSPFTPLAGIVLLRAFRPVKID